MRRVVSITVCAGYLILTPPVWASLTPPPRATVEQRIIALEMLRVTPLMRQLTTTLSELRQTLEQAQREYWRKVLEAPPLCPVHP